MSNQNKEAADKAAADKAAADKAAADKAAADKAAADKAAADKAAADKAAERSLEDTFIMTTSHLSWGRRGRNHFYADKKPLISAKTMKGYSSTLSIWIEKGWVKRGAYK